MIEPERPIRARRLRGSTGRPCLMRRPASSSGRRVAAAVAVAALAVAAPAAAAPGSRFEPGVAGSLGVVATEDPHASRAAIAVLEAGGNAVDAAVAAVMTIGVTRPETCGIGGGGFLIARDPHGRVRALDFRETAPAVGYRYVEGLGPEGIGQAAWGTGHGVVGVPGTVAGLSEAHRVLGSGDPDARWADLVRPAVAAAREGFVLHPETRFAINARAQHLALFPASARTLHPAAKLGDAGLAASFPELAATLSRIAEQPSAFYTGDLAQVLVAEMQRPSALAESGDRSAMTAADLASYRPIWREPVTTTYRGNVVHGVPAPTSGGVAIAEMLNILETFDLAGSGPSSADSLHVLAEAQKIAWADRAAHLGDPAFVDVPAELVSKPYARQRAAEIDLDRAREDYLPLGGGHAPVQAEEGMNTTHVSVLDARGGAVAVTCTIEQALGSGVVVDGDIRGGGGYLLNNQLTDFTPDDPASPNRPEAGKRPRSSTSPTLVVKGGDVVLAVGGQGGPTIIMGVLQAIVNLVDHSMLPAAALDAERIDARGFGPTLNVEDTRIDDRVLTELQRRGHVLTRTGEYDLDPGLNAVGVDRAAGLNRAAGDPRQTRAPMAQTR